MQKIKFISDGNILVGNLFVKDERARFGLLFLHGGGTATKERYRELQEFLLEKNIGSFAFDFRGVGESEGKFVDGSLQKRLIDAISAYNELKKHVDEIVIVGASMGGHVATQLSTSMESAALILLYPGAYAKEAEDKPLNEEFTYILRQENSWIDSPAFVAVENYKKPVLIMYGEQDTVVPMGVQEKYRELVKTKGKFIVLKNAAHPFISPQIELQKKAKEQAFGHISTFLDTIYSEKLITHD